MGGLLPPILPDFIRAHCCPSASCQQKFYLEILVKREVSCMSGRQQNAPLQIFCTSHLSSPSCDTSSDHSVELGLFLSSPALSCNVMLIDHLRSLGYEKALSFIYKSLQAAEAASALPAAPPGSEISAVSLVSRPRSEYLS